MEQIPVGSDVVLVVDDEPHIVALVAYHLAKSGYRVVTAANLHDALILLKTMRPAVVVMGAGLHALRGTSSAEEFHRRLPSNGLVVLPSEFSSHDAGDAGAAVMRAIEERGSPGH